MPADDNPKREGIIFELDGKPLQALSIALNTVPVYPDRLPEEGKELASCIFDLTFESSCDSTLFEATKRARQNFRLEADDGEYVEFSGKMAGNFTARASEEMLYTGLVDDIEIIERGNKFDREGSD